MCRRMRRVLGAAHPPLPPRPPFRYLHGNDLTGSLPAGWAQPASFTVLRYLTVSDNPRMRGSLPLAWGDTLEALSQLGNLNLSNAGLVGPLPAWGTGLQLLETL